MLPTTSHVSFEKYMEFVVKLDCLNYLLLIVDKEKINAWSFQLKSSKVINHKYHYTIYTFHPNTENSLHTPLTNKLTNKKQIQGNNVLTNFFAQASHSFQLNFP